MHLSFLRFLSFALFADQVPCLLIPIIIAAYFERLLIHFALFWMCFLYTSLHQDISVPGNERTIAILSYRVQLFWFITLSMCDLNKLFANSNEISCPNTHPQKEVWEQVIATMTLPGWWMLQAIMNSCLTMMSDHETWCGETEQPDCDWHC